MKILGLTIFLPATSGALQWELSAASLGTFEAKTAAATGSVTVAVGCSCGRAVVESRAVDVAVGCSCVAVGRVK